MGTITLQTGMRYSNYVDFDSGTIFIHESLAKTDRSRFIPISTAVRLALKDVPRKPGVDYMFLNSDTKKPLGNIRKSFGRALRLTKIDNSKFHDLRHTFASHLVRKGVDLYVVQKLLGHTTPKMTQRYAHLRSEQLREAIEKIDIQKENILYNSTSSISENNSTNLAQSPSMKRWS